MQEKREKGKGKGDSTEDGYGNRVAKTGGFSFRQKITIFEHAWHMESILQVRVEKRANENQHVSHILGT